ncbi:D-alanine--D-alanine ligase [Thalassotalea mangrovi]|uniref:D-alanine--D-alanine ligase n=1 Tax=Thalassotalea mangrovi TaxID=2572245 RepID=UPI0024829706|nr:D-alanine--D-alanine ligase [Thalassotalea mangrovi]
MSLITTEQLHQEKIAVLFGGDSAEREVSLKSGEAVVAGLQQQGYQVLGIDTQGFALADLHALKIDRVFIALHGRGGEDGCLQGALEYMQIPYTGSGVLGSALSMDKVRSKQLFAAAGVATASFQVLNREDYQGADFTAMLAELGGKVMVKPAKEGSSIGMSIANDAGQLMAAVELALQYDQQVLIEAWLSGAEYTVAILGEQALPAIRMETPNEFYDYQAKYQSQSTVYHCPCGLPEEQEQSLQAIALQAFRTTGAKGWGRVDVMQDGSGNWQVLEVNTVPGMTETSLVPKAARQAGLEFAELTERILQLSTR